MGTIKSNKTLGKVMGSELQEHRNEAFHLTAFERGDTQAEEQSCWEFGGGFHDRIKQT